MRGRGSSAKEKGIALGVSIPTRRLGAHGKHEQGMGKDDDRSPRCDRPTRIGAVAE
jgi:hypothetical protein